MKKFLSLVFVLVSILCLASCGNDEKKIVVGATPSPHAEILNCSAVKNYIESKGYTLEVKVYQDYKTLNKALNDEGIDANYFQHTDYLLDEIAEKGFKLSVACEVHNEPLNLYGLTPKTDWTNTTVSIINDKTNVERAFQLLLANGVIDSYSVEDFNPQHPVYTSSKNVTIECIDAGLLNRKVVEGGYAVIPGNYALTAWGSTKTSEYKIFGESIEVAYLNIIAVRTADLDSEKTRVLVEALAQKEVQDFITSKYGPTVNYIFKNLLK